jgi:hypothetical protein
MPLKNTLRAVWGEMFRLKPILNAGWDKINRDDPEDPKNTGVILSFIHASAWAYALSIGLVPFQQACTDGPTNPLRFFYIQRLEEIFTKCFAAIHMFGPPNESWIGEFGLLRDFMENGGVDRERKTVGNGFETSILYYLNAYFSATGGHPRSYTCFGDLMKRIDEAVQEYPGVAKAFSQRIRSIPEQNFTKPFQSEAKTSMIAQLRTIGKNAHEDRVRVAA